MTDLGSRRTYLRVQGASVFVWWVVVSAFPSAAELFLPVRASSAFLYAYLPPDCIVLGAGSLATAHVWRQGSPPRFDIGRTAPESMARRQAAAATIRPTQLQSS